MDNHENHKTSQKPRINMETTIRRITGRCPILKYVSPLGFCPRPMAKVFPDLV